MLERTRTYVNKNVNNMSSTQWRGSRSLIGRNLIDQITVETLFCFIPTLLNLTYGYSHL